MTLQVHVNKVEWWFWAITLALICAALGGWLHGYAAVVLVSAVQVVWFAVATGSVISFPVQVRLVYLAATMLGLWAAGRFWVFAVLAVGTAMVTFFDRCAIALALAAMPWNKNAAPRCELPRATAPSRAGKAA